MQVAANTFTPANYNPSIRSLPANFYGNMVYIIDQASLKLNAMAQRIDLIFICIFSLVALYWIHKFIDSRIFVAQPQHPATLASEIECGMESLKNRGVVDNLDFTQTESAKLFLAIKHEGNVFLETVILPQDVRTERILEHFDILSNEIQKQMTFNSTSQIEVSIGILAKDITLHPSGTPIFSNKIYAHTNVHRGKTFDYGGSSSTKILAANTIQDCFCDLMGIPRAPQLDAQGNFI